MHDDRRVGRVETWRNVRFNKIIIPTQILITKNQDIVCAIEGWSKTGPQIIGEEPCLGDPQNLSGQKGPGGTQNYPDTQTGSKISPNLSRQVDMVPKTSKKLQKIIKKLPKNSQSLYELNRPTGEHIEIEIDSYK